MIVLAKSGNGSHGKVATQKKRDIVRRAATLSGMPMKKVEPVVRFIFQAIKDAVEDGETVRISGFGCFYYNEMKGKTIIHPATGKECTYPDRLICKFRPSEKFTHQLNYGFSEDDTEDDNSEKEGVIEVYD